jgi:group I intron endonuclease
MKFYNPNIYLTRNLINDKIYVGQSRYNSPNYIGSGRLITKAKRKYGIKNFQKEILEFCDLEKMNDKEIYWIENKDSIKIGYNLSKGGTYHKYNQEFGNKISNFLKGRKLSVKHKKKISESVSKHVFSLERRKNHSIWMKTRIGPLHNNWGKKLNHTIPFTQQTKDQISKSLKKYYRENPDKITIVKNHTKFRIENSEKFLAIIRANQILSHTPKNKLKRNLGMMGHSVSEEAKQKSRNSNINKTQKHSKKVQLSNLKTGEKIIANNIVHASRIVGCSNVTISNRNGFNYKGYSIKIL